MSNYPPTNGYAMGYGGPGQGNQPYIPPAYQTQYPQTDDGNTGQGQAHFTANYDAYGYNRAMPTFSAPALASGVPPLPIFQGWNQDSIPLPPYTTVAAPYNGYTDTPQYYAPVSQAPYQQPVQDPPFDQRELSEGEFDDGAVATNTPPKSYVAAQYEDSNTMGQKVNSHHVVNAGEDEYEPQHSSLNSMLSMPKLAFLLLTCSSEQLQLYCSECISDKTPAIRLILSICFASRR